MQCDYAKRLALRYSSVKYQSSYTPITPELVRYNVNVLLMKGCLHLIKIRFRVQIFSALFSF